MKVSEIMTPGPITLHPDDLILDCIDIFDENRIHHIPVVTHDGEVVGIVSSRDFENIQSISGILSESTRILKVSDIMSSPVFSYYDDVSIPQVSMAMVDNNIHAIIIMNHEDQMVGIVTSTDLLRHLATLRG